ncbi:MAG: DUF1311 domain-containing protein [Lysobacter sp.]|nr:DUF1311 domain-containing protein [Lysobacter sp.]
MRSTRTVRRVSAVVAIIALHGAAQAASPAPRPSFDCARASSQVERAICADPRLARADAELARVYRSSLAGLDAPAAAALRDEQRWFLQIRDAGYADATEAEKAADLRSTLDYRSKYLGQIQAHPAPGLAGRWRNIAGEIEIRRDAKGRWDVQANAAHPLDGRWVCDAAGRDRGENDTASVHVDDDDSVLKLERAGATLQVTALDAKGQRLTMPDYCGHNGSLEGTYFAVPAAKR